MNYESQFMIRVKNVVAILLKKKTVNVKSGHFLIEDFPIHFSFHLINWIYWEWIAHNFTDNILMQLIEGFVFKQKLKRRHIAAKKNTQKNTPLATKKSISQNKFHNFCNQILIKSTNKNDYSRIFDNICHFRLEYLISFERIIQLCIRLKQNCLLFK